MTVRKIFSICLTVALLLSLSACGKTQQDNSMQESEVAADSAGETAPLRTADSGTDSETEDVFEHDHVNEHGNKILIAYFTCADNTKVKNPDAVDIDASTSASVLAPGNVARMAGWIQEEVGGDLFSIRVKDLYSSDYDECLDRAADEKAKNARPQLTEVVENIEDYDTVFLGYPNWWYSVPMPVLNFIDRHNLSGKKIVLFCSHGTGGLAGSVEDITAELPSDCAIEENVIGIYRDDIPSGQSVIKKWLKEIGY